MVRVASSGWQGTIWCWLSASTTTMMRSLSTLATAWRTAASSLPVSLSSARQSVTAGPLLSCHHRGRPLGCHRKVILQPHLKIQHKQISKGKYKHFTYIIGMFLQPLLHSRPQLVSITREQPGLLRQLIQAAHIYSCCECHSRYSSLCQQLLLLLINVADC